MATGSSFNATLSLAGSEWVGPRLLAVVSVVNGMVTQQILDFIAAQKQVTGKAPGEVYLSQTQYDQLAKEMGVTSSTYKVWNIEGVKIMIVNYPIIPSIQEVPKVKVFDFAETEKKLIGELADFKTMEEFVVAAVQKASSAQSQLTGLAKDIALAEQNISKLKAHEETQAIGTALEEVLAHVKEPKVYHLSTSDDHGTPQALYETLNKRFHFDLDPCASDPMEAHEVPGESPLLPPAGVPLTAPLPPMLDPGTPTNSKCSIYFTPSTDGLSQNWFGRVFMNPPYTKGQIKVWIKKLVSEIESGRVDLGVALVAARTDTNWFHFASCYACEILFLHGRLTFEGSMNPAPFPSAILVFDKSKSHQVVRFWDWQEEKATLYAYQGPFAKAMALEHDYENKPKGIAKVVSLSQAKKQALQGGFFTGWEE